MKLVEVSTAPTGTRYVFSWSYRKLENVIELKNILQGRNRKDILDIIEFGDPETKKISVAFQIGNNGLFQSYKETYRYVCDWEMFYQILRTIPVETPDKPLENHRKGWLKNWLSFLKQ